jgi:hypothetical protein
LAMGHLPGCSSACRIAGPYRDCRLRGRAEGRARAGTAAGGSPSVPYCLRAWRRGAGPCSCAVCWAVTVVADRQWREPRRSWGCPTERGLPAGQHHCGYAFGQVAVSPNRAPRPSRLGCGRRCIPAQRHLPRESKPDAARGRLNGNLTVAALRGSRLNLATNLTRSPRRRARAVPDSGAGIGGPRSRSDHGP